MNDSFGVLAHEKIWKIHCSSAIVLISILKPGFENRV